MRRSAEAKPTSSLAARIDISLAGYNAKGILWRVEVAAGLAVAYRIDGNRNVVAITIERRRPPRVAAPRCL